MTTKSEEEEEAKKVGEQEREKNFGKIFKTLEQKKRERVKRKKARHTHTHTQRRKPATKMKNITIYIYILYIYLYKRERERAWVHLVLSFFPKDVRLFSLSPSLNMAFPFFSFSLLNFFFFSLFFANENMQVLLIISLSLTNQHHNLCVWRDEGITREREIPWAQKKKSKKIEREKKKKRFNFWLFSQKIWFFLSPSLFPRKKKKNEICFIFLSKFPCNNNTHASSLSFSRQNVHTYT